jgi:restriction system protein
MTKSKAEVIIWGIHAGKTGDADHIFLKENFVAIGWYKMKDLSKIPAEREAFKKKVAEAYPDAKPGAIPNYAGQTFRFIHEMKEGDLIAYPSKRDRKIHIGKITGPYRYDPTIEEGYPNLRPVEWLKTLPRTDFSQAALYEIGSAMSFFQIKNYAEEFQAALSGSILPLAPKDDATVGEVSENIEQTTKDFILKKLATELKGHPLEDFVAHLFEVMGYQTRISPEGADGGIDIIAHKDELGFEPPLIKIQVKSKDGTIGDPEVSALYGKVSPNEFGLIITLSTFSTQAKHFARNKSNLRLIDGEELIDLVLKHYENFNSRYKGLIPLKRVYIPESIEDGVD